MRQYIRERLDLRCPDDACDSGRLPDPIVMFLSGILLIYILNILHNCLGYNKWSNIQSLEHDGSEFLIFPKGKEIVKSKYILLII